MLTRRIWRGLWEGSLFFHAKHLTLPNREALFAGNYYFVYCAFVAFSLIAIPVFFIPSYEFRKLKDNLPGFDWFYKPATHSLLFI